MIFEVSETKWSSFISDNIQVSPRKNITMSLRFICNNHADQASVIRNNFSESWKVKDTKVIYQYFFVNYYLFWEDVVS